MDDLELSKKLTVLDSLKEYFANNSREQIEKDWNETEEWDNVGPTVEEFMDHNLFCTKIKSEKFK